MAAVICKATVYLKINCNLEFSEIGLRLAPNATPDSFEHDSENVYEWMYVNIEDVPFALNVSREHGWAVVDDELLDCDSGISQEELKLLVKPGPVYIFGWKRSTDSYVDELPEWLPQFVADNLNVDVLVYNGRINVDVPDGEPFKIVPPQPANRK